MFSVRTRVGRLAAHKVLGSGGKEEGPRGIRGKGEEFLIDPGDLNISCVPLSLRIPSLLSSFSPSLRTTKSKTKQNTEFREKDFDVSAMRFRKIMDR